MTTDFSITSIQKSDQTLAASKLTTDKCERFGFVYAALKGGDPAAPSDTATLLRLHPSHEPHRGNRPPCG